MAGADEAGAAGAGRCAWAAGEPLYAAYHDAEWGRPDADERRIFEKLCLEGFQAGLAWITILRKREAFRARFAGFDPERLARFGPREIAAALADPGIVRHRGKIVSAVNNARAVLALRERGESLAALVWSFEPPEAERPAIVDAAFVAAHPETPASRRLSKALKAGGFSFVGPTTMHALMQAKGLVNDHVEGCPCREPCERERAAFRRPR